MLIGAGDKVIRLVTHLNSSQNDIDLFVSEVDAFFN
jgi:threonine aldolase